MSDLSDLLVPPPGAGPPPGWGFGGDGPARYGQGVIVEWDPKTFRNKVRFHGAVLADLPVMAGPDALTYQPGDIVGIMHWSPVGGSGQHWILPRMIVPGTGAAERAIAALTTDLGRSVAAAVFAARTFAAVTPDQITVTSTTFTSMNGPTIEGIEVSGGVMLIWIDADIRVSTFDQGDSEGAVSPAISGATVRPAGYYGLRAVQLNRGTNDFATAVSAGGAGLFVATGLSPGLHDVEVQYRAFVNAGGNPPVLHNRRLAVLAL